MPTIYILKCEQNRYYIGKTERSLDSRIKEHFLNNGSEWTRKYKPIKLIDTIQNADDFDEDKYTKIYMKKYGINNVRGGSYTQINLPEYSIISFNYQKRNFVVLLIYVSDVIEKAISQVNVMLQKEQMELILVMMIQMMKNHVLSVNIVMNISILNIK